MRWRRPATTWWRSRLLSSRRRSGSAARAGGAQRGSHCRGVRVRALFRVPGCGPGRLFRSLLSGRRCRRYLSTPPLLMAAAAGATQRHAVSPHDLGAADLVQRQRGRRPVRRGLRAFVLLTLWAVLGPSRISLADGRGRQRSAGGGDPRSVRSGWKREARRRWKTVGCLLRCDAVWLAGFRTGCVLNLPATAAWMAVLGTVCWPLRRWQASARRLERAEVARVPWGAARGWTLQPFLGIAAGCLNRSCGTLSRSMRLQLRLPSGGRSLPRPRRRRSSGV